MKTTPLPRPAPAGSLRGGARQAAAVLLASLLTAAASAQVDPAPAAPSSSSPVTAVRRRTSDTHLLVTGKAISLSHVLPRQNVGSLPTHLVATPDGNFVVTTDSGYRESLWVTRTSDGQGVSHLDFTNDTVHGVYPNLPSGGPNYGLYYGLALKADGTLYAAQGVNDSIAVLGVDLTTGALSAKGSIKTRKNDTPAGLALDDRGYLYVANNDPGVFTTPCSVAVYDTNGNNAEVGRYVFGGFGTNYPFAVAVLRDGRKLYVTSERDGTVSVFDTTDPTSPKLSKTLTTGRFPMSLLFTKAQDRLLVANAHDDTVSVIDTKTDAVAKTFSLRLAGVPTGKLLGLTPTALALSPDEKRLYVTLGDYNAVGVVDFTEPVRPKVLGYLPAGWYPDGVAVSPDGVRLLVANAKGTQALHPNPSYLNFQDPTGYDQNLIEGQVTIQDLPTKQAVIDLFTRQVFSNNAPIGTHGLRRLGRARGRIEHVIYIVKENKTYDQILGDLPQGNGDPSLVVFGPDVTPNQHALAQRFVLLDNFYVCGEVSRDGWTWTVGGMANEWVIRNVPYNYSGRNYNDDTEGMNNGYPPGGLPATDLDGNPLSQVYPNGFAAFPDISQAAGGSIWDTVRRAGLPLRNYGCYTLNGIVQNGQVVVPDNYPGVAGIQPGGRDLAGYTDLDFRRYDLTFPDSDAPALAHATPVAKPFGKYQLSSRFAEFKREFNEMLAQDPTGGTVPAFMSLRMGQDHTQGSQPGAYSPRAEVADNDYAVGQMVDLVSHSPIWKHTAFFIVEDDAQDGADHVDCHRSTAYVISPYVKRGAVDHTFYNTDGVLRAIEDLLGAKPINQYDRVAVPVARNAFDQRPSNAEPFDLLPFDPAIIRETNPALSQLSEQDPRRALALRSLRLDFRGADRAPARELNEIIWKSVKGADAPVPAPRHAFSLAALRRGRLEPVAPTRSATAATAAEPDGDED